MDELRNAIKEKMDWSVDRMVRATDSPFVCLKLSRLTGLRTLRITLIPSKRH